MEPALPDTGTPFRHRFEELFRSHFERVHRLLDRLSGDPDLAADLAQEAFARLYRRGTAPDRPEAWLVTVALNLFRNARSARSRRGRLLTAERVAQGLGDPAPSPERAAEAAEERRRVRRALDVLRERDRMMLLLRAEGYAYRDIAAALDLDEASVGTLLARARSAFRAAYGEAD